MPSLIGQELILVVHKLDIRFIKAYLSNGKFLGLLRVSYPWNRVKHSLRTRKAIMSCINQGKIARNSSDPIKAYHELLAKNSLTLRRARNTLTRFERETGLNNENIDKILPEQNKNIQGENKYLHRKGWISIT